MAATTTDTRDLFEDDDEETLRYLLTDDSADGSIESRLQAFSKRFVADHDSGQDPLHWTAFVDSAKDLGFQFNGTRNVGPRLMEATGSFPSAFESENGKRHVKATAAILNVSENRAIQLTMSSLRSLKESTNIQSLLGTTTLLEKVTEYHFKQRVVRLSVIAECLRKEQDTNDAASSSIKKVLDSLDTSYVEKEKNRGLFKYLVSIACQKNENLTPNRQQLLPVKELKGGTPASLQESLAQNPEQQSWHQYVSNFTVLNRQRVQRERVEAMEALVVLLYQRIQGGIRRVDFVLLLLAFQSSDAFFTGLAEEERLSQMAGLICGECMGLWRVLEENSHSNTSWLFSHPLLLDAVPARHNVPGRDSAQAEEELETLKNLLLKYASYVGDDRIAPESIALLSFGLVLVLAHSSISVHPSESNGADFWRNAGTEGLELVRIATDRHSALDFFRSLMEDLVSDPMPQKQEKELNTIPYDALYSGVDDSSSFAICDGVGLNEMDAASLTYASIGHEILSALTLAFQDEILSVHQPTACRNIAMVCDLAATIYRNSPTLCEPFWVDWEAFTSAKPPSKIPPMCNVMDSSFLLVSNAHRVEQFEGTKMSSVQLLATLSPLMRLVSSVCYNAESVESAFGILPPSMLQKALLCCSLDKRSEDPDSCNLRWGVLDSFARMTRIGDSAACRGIIREALGEGELVAGTRILLRVLSNSDERSFELVLNISADLLKDAPVQWALAFVQGLQGLSLSRVSEKRAAGFPFCSLFNGLINSMTAVLFSSNCDDPQAEAFLDLIWSGVLRMSSLLSKSLSNIAQDPIPIKTVQSIFAFFVRLLESVRPIIVLHKSVAVQNRARGIRDSLVEMLSGGNNFGESVMYYALLPVTYGIGMEIEKYIQERHIIQHASMEETQGRGRYGLWHSAAIRNFESPTIDTVEQNYVKDLVENGFIDLEAIRVSNRTSGGPLLATVIAALNLLKLWAQHLEDIIVGVFRDDVSYMVLDNEQKSKLMSDSPHNLLGMSAGLPYSMRGKDKIAFLWDAANPSNLQLLSRYLDSNNWPVALSSLSLDLMDACFVQMKLGSSQSSVADLPLFKIVLPRSNFNKAMGKLLERCFRSVAGDDGKEAKVLGILGLHVVRSMAEAMGPSQTCDVLSDELIRHIFKEIEAASDSFHQAREAVGAELLSDKRLLEKLRIASSCQRLLIALWEPSSEASSVSRGKGIANQVWDDSSIPMTLARIVLQHARIGTPDCDKYNGKAVVTSFMASTVDLLRLSTEFALDCDPSINGAMMQIWRENSIEIMSMPKHFLSIDGCIDVAMSVDQFPLSAPLTTASEMALSNPTLLLQLCPIAATKQMDSDIFNIDVFSASKLMDALAAVNMSSEFFRDKILLLASSSHFLSSQIALLDRWHQFSKVLLHFSVSNGSSYAGGTTPSQLAFPESESPLLNCALETLKLFQRNITNVESAQIKSRGGRNLGVGKMYRAMSELILCFVVKGINNMTRASSAGLLKEALDLVSLSSYRSFGLLETNVEECCVVEQELMASSAALFTALQSSTENAVSHAKATNSHDFANQLLTTASKLLKIIEVRHIIPIVKRDCLKTCLVVLSILTAESLEPKFFMIGRYALRSILAKSFDELDVMATVVRHGKVYSEFAFKAQRKSKERKRPVTVDESEENAFDVLESIFDLILMMSQKRDTLHLLPNTGVFEMLTGNPLFGSYSRLWESLDSNQAPSIPLRGYIPTKEKVMPLSPSREKRNEIAFLAGKNDPVHDLWQKALRCFRTFLASSKIERSPISLEKERSHSLAADFIATHQQMMLASLKKLQSSPFTKNSLSEAALILSLVSEFCKRPCPDRRMQHAIHEQFLPLAVSLVSRIGSYLGASATSREFFDAVADVDEASDSEVDMGARLLPFGRVQNVRHEAIRYAHYASRLCTAVTREDFETSSHAGKDDLRSASGLENHGRASMTCVFEKAMENAAAQCMFFALSLIWETHPANSSFIMFSDVEANKIDAMSLVKLGMIIAFSPDKESDRSRHVWTFPSRSIRFAQVVHCDTLERVWYVRNLDTLENEIVHAGQIMGLEDTSKRSCVLTYAPAPDSATELEAFTQSASVGHLILSLRWCADFFRSSAAFVNRFAELLSVLLGTELSLHAELGSALNKPKEDVERLEAQLLDLFQGSSEGEESREGRMKSVLGILSWQAVRQQLQKELNKAEATQQAHTAKHEIVESGPFWGGVGRSSNRNPFDELRMDLG